MRIDRLSDTDCLDIIFASTSATISVEQSNDEVIYTYHHHRLYKIPIEGIALHAASGLNLKATSGLRMKCVHLVLQRWLAAFTKKYRAMEFSASLL